MNSIQALFWVIKCKTVYKCVLWPYRNNINLFIPIYFAKHHVPTKNNNDMYFCRKWAGCSKALKSLVVPHQFILSAALQDLVSREEKKNPSKSQGSDWPTLTYPSLPQILERRLLEWTRRWQWAWYIRLWPFTDQWGGVWAGLKQV